MELETCDVIVTYCWNRVGYNIVRSLADKGLKVVVGDTSKHNICSYSKFVAGSFIYPDPFTQELAFIDTLLQKIEELRPKVLMPTHDESIVIAKNRHRFPKDLVIPIDSYQQLTRLSDKTIATSIAASVGLPTPKVYSNIEDIAYPLVVKPRIGNSAKGVIFVNTEKKLKKLLSNHSHETTLWEEYIPGTDFSVDCVRWNNQFYASVYEALLTKTDGGGTTTQRVMVDFPLLCNYAKNFLDAVDYRGVCGLDFRVDKATGRIAFIELNARFTGGLATPIAAGFDIPYILYSLATMQTYRGFYELKKGVKTKWILGDAIVLVSSVLHGSLTTSKLKNIFNFHGFETYDDYRRDDRRVLIGEMNYYLRKLITHRQLNP